MEALQFEQNETNEHQALLEIVHKMETVSDSDMSPEQIREESKTLVRELLSHLESDLNFHLSDDVSAVYNEMHRENLLARVESVARIIECIVEHKPVHVGNDEKHYANSVTADIEGLRIAMAEADTIEPVRLMIGLDLKALVGFESDHLKVSEIDDNENDLRDIGLRKSFCRHVSGDILPEDLKYMVMRIPRVFFPEESLNEVEIGKQSQYIFRTANLKNVLQTDQSEDFQKAA